MIKQLLNPKYHILPSKVIADKQSNLLILEEINKGNPLMISRFGLTELFTCKNYLDIEKTTNGNFFKKYFYKKRGYTNYWKENVKKEINELSGVFPTSLSQLSEFSKIYIQSSKFIDILVHWNMSFETYFINLCCPKAKLINPIGIEPYFHNQPWSAALKNKKVLVIHPFTKTIEEQYEKHESLFSDKTILPDFELITIKAVQSLANNPTEFISWTEAFTYLCKKIDYIDFDIAIIGAGAYGLPLAAHIKKKGKVAIHMGGATQILFGIKGKRWDERPEINKFYNKHWVYPQKSEYPINYKKTDSGCYW